MRELFDTTPPRCRCLKNAKGDEDRCLYCGKTIEPDKGEAERNRKLQAYEERVRRLRDAQLRRQLEREESRPSLF